MQAYKYFDNVTQLWRLRALLSGPTPEAALSAVSVPLLFVTKSSFRCWTFACRSDLAQQIVSSFSFAVGITVSSATWFWDWTIVKDVKVNDYLKRFCFRLQYIFQVPSRIYGTQLRDAETKDVEKQKGAWVSTGILGWVVNKGKVE